MAFVCLLSIVQLTNIGFDVFKIFILKQLSFLDFNWYYIIIQLRFTSTTYSLFLAEQVHKNTSLNFLYLNTRAKI